MTRPKAFQFQTPRLGAAAEFSVPRVMRPKSNLDEAGTDAFLRHTQFDKDGNAISADAQKTLSDIQANLEGLYHQAKNQDIDPAQPFDGEDYSGFEPPAELSYATAYMMNHPNPRKRGIQTQALNGGRTDASILKTNGEEVVRGMYGDRMAGSILERFIRRNGKGHNGLLNIDHDGPEAHLYNPAYIIRGDAQANGAQAYYSNPMRYAYLPTWLNDEFVIPHELTHLNIEGRMPGPGLSGLPTWDDIKASLRKDRDGRPTVDGDPNDRRLWFLERWSDPHSGAAELAADWTLANRGRSAAIGDPDRSDARILENLQEATLGHRIHGPTMQLGPQSGSEMYWHPYVEEAIDYYWNMPKQDGTPLLSPENRDLLKKMLLDSGSTQDGHPKYPNV